MQDDRQPLSPVGEGARFTPPEEFGRRLFGLTGRPIWTPMIVGANFAVYAAMALTGAGFMLPDEDALLRWGGNFGPYTTSGEWWRLVTCAFIHAGFIHIAVNMWALWSIGRVVERMFGRSGFLAIYFITAVMASLTSALWRPGGLSVGASGAVFGVYGAFLAFAIRQRSSIPPPALAQLQRGAVITLGLNLLIGVGVPFIDMAAHVGGFLSGLLCGFAIARPLTPLAISGRWRRSLAAAVYGAALAVASAYVMRKPFADLAPRLREMKERGLAMADLREIRDQNSAELAALFINAQASLDRGDLDLAEKDATRLCKLEPKFPGGHQLMGFVHLERGDGGAAEAAWRKTAALFDSPHERACTLENIGLIHLRSGDFAKALANTTEVNHIEKGLAWNSLIRAIAADKLGEGVIARAAMEVWEAAEKDKATLQIGDFLPPELKPYMKGFPKEETLKAGKPDGAE